MKTLDEVIDELKAWKSITNSESEFDLAINAIHYLNKYQKIEDEYEELKDWWAEEHAENVPLTWDELKEMEGEPVWVEEKYSFCDDWHGQWEVIRNIWDNEYSDVPYLWMTDDENRYKDTLGEIWQAYRKKRK